MLILVFNYMKIFAKDKFFCLHKNKYTIYLYKNNIKFLWQDHNLDFLTIL